MAYDQKTDTSSWYIVYKAVEINARLFSRATMVWRIIADTRGAPTSRPPKLGILKDQVVRQSEASFYYRLADKIPEAERYGIIKLECGEVDARLWEQSTPYLHLMPDAQCQLRLSATQTQPNNAKSSTTSRHRRPQRRPLRHLRVLRRRPALLSAILIHPLPTLFLIRYIRHFPRHSSRAPN